MTGITSIRELRRKLLACAAIGVFAGSSIAPAFAGERDGETASPIKHVIIIIGENRSFDHVFATYKPVNRDEKVLNLLSRGIVKDDGSPGPNYFKGLQSQGTDTTEYEIAPQKQPYTTLPPALVGGPSTPYACQFVGVTTGTSCVSPANIAAVQPYENGLAADYYQYLLTGGTGQASKTPDQRVSYDGQGPTTLPPGPYQLTNANYPYDAYAASPVHRFDQMQQQLDCDAHHANWENGWGCASDLYPWVEVTVGAGSNGKAQPAGFDDTSTGEGSTSMGFYNVQNGDAPYLKYLADTYTMSDNYHQAVKGGTGANHIMLGTGDAIWFSDGNGSPQTPPSNPVNPASPGTPATGYTNALNEIENPESAAGHQQLLHPGRLRRRVRFSDGDEPVGELWRRLLCQLPRQHPARRRATAELSPGPAAPGSSQLRRRPLLSRQQLQPGLFRRRLERLHRSESEQLCLHDPAVDG